MRFAARESAIFSQFEPAFGVLPGGGATQHLVRLMGRSRTLEVMLSADDYDAELAERYGWINRALPADELGDFVSSLAHRIAAVSGRRPGRGQGPGQRDRASRRPRTSVAIPTSLPGRCANPRRRACSEPRSGAASRPGTPKWTWPRCWATWLGATGADSVSTARRRRKPRCQQPNHPDLKEVTMSITKTDTPTPRPTIDGHHGLPMAFEVTRCPGRRRPRQGVL